jgi:hypothetical protein
MKRFVARQGACRRAPGVDASLAYASWCYSLKKSAAGYCLVFRKRFLRPLSRLRSMSSLAQPGLSPPQPGSGSVSGLITIACTTNGPGSGTE